MRPADYIQLALPTAGQVDSYSVGRSANHAISQTYQSIDGAFLIHCAEESKEGRKTKQHSLAASCACSGVVCCLQRAERTNDEGEGTAQVTSEGGDGRGGSPLIIGKPQVGKECRAPLGHGPRHAIQHLATVDTPASNKHTHAVQPSCSQCTLH